MDGQQGDVAMIKFFERDPRRTIYVVLALICLAGLYFSAKHFLRSDEDIIRESIQDAARAVEHKDIDAISRAISTRYHGSYGANKEEAVEMARDALGEVERLHITIDRTDIRIKGRTATVTCYFFVSGLYTGSSIYNAIPFKGLGGKDSSKPDRAYIVLEKDADRWLISWIQGDIPGATPGIPTDH
jgi:hypothetical protein